MQKITDSAALDFIDEDILYCWGCPSYSKTLEHLEALSAITVDPAYKKHIEELRAKLLLCKDPDHYEQLYYLLRLSLEQGMTAKLRFARELMNYEVKI